MPLFEYKVRASRKAEMGAVPESGGDHFRPGSALMRGDGETRDPGFEDPRPAEMSIRESRATQHRRGPLSTGLATLIFILMVPASALAGNIEGRIKARGVRHPDNILVYIKHAPGDFPAAKKPKRMDQKDLVFSPHILPILNGTTVEFLNSEKKIQHNVFSPDAVAGKLNLGTYPPGAKRSYTFNHDCSRESGTCNAAILCHVHPEMSAYVVILQNPYFALTDRHGNFEIKDVPPGEYTLVAWHEKLRENSQSVTVTEGSVNLKLAMRK